jgi:hypothetical protein
MEGHDAAQGPVAVATMEHIGPASEREEQQPAAEAASPAQSPRRAGGGGVLSRVFRSA